jgi:curved DNA-binding protein CbpA
LLIYFSRLNIKDYYTILGLQPSASIPDVKQAYRKLAMQFHPDKNADDKYAAAQFADIKEAYEVLSNPHKKEIYLQQRWYNQSIGKRRTEQTVTPVNILKQSLELSRYTASLDTYRMDKQGLCEYIEEMISTEKIDRLNNFNEPGINAEIIKAVLQAAKPLSYDQLLAVSDKLKLLAVNNEAIVKKIDSQLQQKMTAGKWNRYRPVLILLITLIICIVIFFLSGK